MSWVYLLKFIHIILALGLVGTAIYCVVAVGLKKSHTLLKQVLLLLAFLALLTGSLLVLPKHYSFTTPWIQAAYALVMVFALLVTSLLVWNKKRGIHHRGWWIMGYVFLIVLLVMIIHDAVTKSTFIL